MIQRVSALWVRLKANRLAYTFPVLLTLTVGILIGTVISSGVKGQDKKSSTSDVAPLVVPSPQQLSNQFSQISKQLEPSVVNINTESTIKTPKRRRGAPPNGDDDASPFDDFLSWPLTPEEITVPIRIPMVSVRRTEKVYARRFAFKRTQRALAR